MFYAYKDLTDTIIEQTSEKRGKMELWLDKALDWVVEKGILLLMTLLFLFIGSKIIRFILKIIDKAFERRKLSKSVAGFLISFFRIILYVLLFISAAALLGFQVTSFVTLLGASGITIGLALQGSLSNLAGGVLILILKPFDLGDYILENNTKCEGTVEGIDIFYTKIRTYDNRLVVIPNGNLSNTSIVNYTKLGVRMIELNVGISYSSDIRKAKKVLEETVRGLKFTLMDRDIVSYVDRLDDSAVVLGIRFFVKSSDYFPAKWSANEEVKIALDSSGVVIPFNQLDVHISDDLKING